MAKIRKVIKAIGATVLVAVLAVGLYQSIKLGQAIGKLDNAFAPYDNAAKIADPAHLVWADLSSRQQEILLRIEDPGFFDHKGVDFSSNGAGLTTITQAVTKVLFFDDFQPGFAKLEQTLIARFVISPNIDKQTQLNAFVNLVYLGHQNGKPVYGLNEGAEVYFSKPVSELTDDEFLRLTGALIAPKTYPPIKGNENSDARLDRLKKLTAGECMPLSVTDVTLEGCM